MKLAAPATPEDAAILARLPRRTREAYHIADTWAGMHMFGHLCLGRYMRRLDHWVWGRGLEVDPIERARQRFARARRFARRTDEAVARLRRVLGNGAPRI